MIGEEGGGGDDIFNFGGYVCTTDEPNDRPSVDSVGPTETARRDGTEPNEQKMISFTRLIDSFYQRTQTTDGGAARLFQLSVGSRRRARAPARHRRTTDGTNETTKKDGN